MFCLGVLFRAHFDHPKRWKSGLEGDFICFREGVHLVTLQSIGETGLESVGLFGRHLCAIAEWVAAGSLGGGLTVGSCRRVMGSTGKEKDGVGVCSWPAASFVNAQALYTEMIELFTRAPE